MELFLALPFLLCPSLAFQFLANLQVDEYGAHFNQTEVFDPITGDIITHVPAHWRNGIFLQAVTKIDNENLGFTVWKLEDEDVCYLEDMDPNEDPSRFMLEVAYLEAHNVTLDGAEIKTINLQVVDDGEWEGDRKDLTEDMASLCEGLPIRKVREEEIDDRMVHRRKRLAPPTPSRRWCWYCWVGSLFKRSVGSPSQIVHKVY